MGIKNKNIFSFFSPYRLSFSPYLLFFFLFSVLSVSLWCKTVGAQEEPAGGSVNPAVVSRLVGKLNSRFYDDRRAAREKLSAMGPAAMAPLVEALKSDVAGVRSGAVLILGRLKVKETLPELIRMMDDPSLEVRKMAVEALALLGTEAIDSLRAYLDKAEGKRRELIEGLLGRALEDAVKQYLEKMQVAPGRTYLYCPGPIEELKKLGPGVLKALERLANWQRYPLLSYYAMNAMGDLGDESARDFLKKKIEESKAMGHMVYRAGASMALSKLGEPSHALGIIRDIRLDVYPTAGPGKHSSLGATYLEIGRLDEAEKEFEEARKLQPGEVSYTFRLGCVHGAKGDAKKAIPYLKEAVEKDFVKASSLQRIGYFKKIRETEEWKKFIEEALKKEKAEPSKEDEEKNKAKTK